MAWRTVWDETFDTEALKRNEQPPKWTKKHLYTELDTVMKHWKVDKLSFHQWKENVSKRGREQFNLEY